MRITYKLDDNAYIPTKAHSTDAGFDLRTPIDFGVPAGGAAAVDTGVHVAIPEGYVGFIKSKSGLNVNYGLTAEGVIDSGYTGSIKVKLYNGHSVGYNFKKGDKITQLVILPIPEVELVEGEMSETERGDNGFGSTGR